MKPLSSRFSQRLWRFILALAAVVVIVGASLAPALVASDALAADSIGEVTKKRMDVYGTPPDTSRSRIYPNDEVYFGEVIETSGGAAIMIRFEDETELLLGERAKLVIDDFVYEPATGSGRAVYEFSVGTLRFVSGKMADEGVTILTPNANIGIRGSEAIIFVTPEGETIVNVTKGRFSVRSRDRPDVPSVSVEMNENVSVSGVADFSAKGTGIKLPEYSHDPAAKEPDFSDDLYDLKEGGSFDTSREGVDAGSRDSGGDSDGDHGGHH